MVLKPIPDIPDQQFNDSFGDEPYEKYHAKAYYGILDEVEDNLEDLVDQLSIFTYWSVHRQILGIHLS